MPTIPAISSATSAIPGAAASTASRVPQKILGQNDFLKLLAKQFQTQDPMKPMEDTAFIAQMAQFSSLEQAGAMSKDLAQLRADQQRVTANSYLGHRVTVDAGSGTTVAGDVTAVDSSGAAPQLVINGAAFPLSAVLRVEPGVVTVPQPAPTGGA
jgi:flagellar basal-body rod modification protein FlgD